MLSTSVRSVSSWYIFLGFLQILDVVTTWFALSSPHATESNGLVSAAIDMIGLGATLVVVLLIKLLLVFGLFLYGTKVRFVTFVYVAVILNNLAVIFALYA